MKFSHLHVHTQYSLLDGASSIKSILTKAVEDKMPGVAITDHGNMFGVFEFVAEAYKIAQSTKHAIKPIIGCEFYISEDASVKDKSRRQYHQLLLAKNQIGYQNLLRLSHLSYVEGFYRKPCIDKEMLLQHHEGLIASSCCLASMVARRLIEEGEAKAEAEIKWWVNVFEDDYYLELQKHGLADQEKLNAFLIKMSRKYNLKLICTNDTHYTEESFAPLHEVLLCINTGSFMSDPPKTEEDFADASKDVDSQGKKIKKRFAFANNQFFFKTTAQMEALFVDTPEALDNTNEIVDKVERLNLQKDIMLPIFPLPPGFTSQFEYLRHLAQKGLRKKYQQITPDIEERLAFELSVIEKMDYSGYFLIVADFIKAAQDLGVLVGPGRGSAAGSLVAYLTDITKVDPIKYNLLFERFLNPERRGMPDIDIDFDDVGRSQVIDYIIQKYGANQSAQIVTFNTMGAKSAMKDVARVYEYDFQKSNIVSKLLSSQYSIEDQLKACVTDDEALKAEGKFSPQDIDKIKKLRKYYEEDKEMRNIIDIAKGIDGSIRNVGVHAAGIIITPQPVETMIPVCKVKDNEMLITQIHGKDIENAGVIKMDILGLSTLNTLQRAIILIEKHHQTKIDLNSIPLDDDATYALYQRGDTIGTFQFESEGMRQHLRQLKPDRLEDLIALNALYRPGPMQFIPSFIRRKHKKEEIEYAFPDLEPILKETFGITVYQEQVMLIAQLLADFSKGEADVLRKAMGKKNRQALDEKKVQFLTKAKAKGYPTEALKKIWSEWEKFADYAFNKSHSTCYAIVSYQTAYLKANYPHEYMTALLQGAKDIKEIGKIMDEIKRMGIAVLSPSVNESQIGFAITSQNAIRFGLSAIKGIGRRDSELIINLRKEHNHFEDVYHFMRCLAGSIGSGKIESLIKAGAFDCFTGIKRHQYFQPTKKQLTFIEALAQYSKRFAKQKIDETAPQLPGFDSIVLEQNTNIPHPETPPIDNKDINELETLKYEKEMIGIYVSKHPLSQYDFEFKNFEFTNLHEFGELENWETNPNSQIDAQHLVNNYFLLGGIIESATQRTSKKGTPYVSLTISDFKSSHHFTFFGKDFQKVKDFCIPDSHIYMIMTYEPDRYNAERIRAHIKDIGHLSDFAIKHTKEIHLYTQKEYLNPEWITYLDNHIMQSPSGNTKLYIHLSLNKKDTLSVKIPDMIQFDDKLKQYIELQSHLYCKLRASHT